MRDTMEEFVDRADRGRSAWPWIWVASITFGVLWLLAPRVELWLWPVYGTQEIADVERDPGRLCWERLTEKLRTPDVQNYDVFLDRLNAAGDKVVHSFPEIYNEATDEPISTERAPGVGWSRRRLCIALPRDIKPTQPTRLRQVVHFRGVLGLWDLPVPLPTITSPRGTSLPS